MYGDGAGTMSTDELDGLEKYLEEWVHHVRSIKVNSSFHIIIVMFITIH